MDVVCGPQPKQTGAQCAELERDLAATQLYRSSAPISELTSAAQTHSRP